MYPDLKYFLQSLFGVPMPDWLGIVKTFGFFVAMSFIAAAQVMVSELKRKERGGLLHPVLKTIKEKIKNTDGNGSSEVTKEVKVYPHTLITEIVFTAAIGGIVGAKIFNALETWSDFIRDPMGSLFSRSGLTFYGGLIVATIALYYFTRRYKIPFKHFCDAAAPAIMIAYGIGRLGCQFSGDGDWGIFNSAYVTQQDGTLKSATVSDRGFIAHMTMGAEKANFPAPMGLPNWMFGMNYPHNVINEGIQLQGCSGDFCSVLPVSVFPTPMYEAVTCILLFFFLWWLRKRIKRPLHLFAVYLLLAGVERFFVELIRVNTTYDLGFIHPTQAEIISVVLVLTSFGILLFYKPKPEVLTVT